MDLIALAMAKKYTDQKAGYSEWSYGTIKNDDSTFDGFTVSASEIGLPSGTVRYLRIKKTGVPAENITTVITGLYGDRGTEYKVKRVTREIHDDVAFVYAIQDKYPDVIVVDTTNVDLSALNGVYVYEDMGPSSTYYIYGIEGDIIETVRTINPKYLPGTYLPVVELTVQADLSGSFDEEDSAKLANLLVGNTEHFFAKITMFGAPLLVPMTRHGVDRAYAGIFANYVVYIVQGDEGWGYSLNTLT